MLARRMCGSSECTHIAVRRSRLGLLKAPVGANSAAVGGCVPGRSVLQTYIVWPAVAWRADVRKRGETLFCAIYILLSYRAAVKQRIMLLKRKAFAPDVTEFHLETR
jgi:hypothetical protein